MKDSVVSPPAPFPPSTGESRRLPRHTAPQDQGPERTSTHRLPSYPQPPTRPCHHPLPRGVRTRRRGDPPGAGRAPYIRGLGMERETETQTDADPSPAQGHLFTLRTHWELGRKMVGKEWPRAPRLDRRRGPGGPLC